MFRVGQKVVCVDASNNHYGTWPLNTIGLDGLRQDEVYTVRRVGMFRGLEALWLAEITRPADYFGEYGYALRRFRPIVERKTDISIFKRMLTPKKENANV